MSGKNNVDKLKELFEQQKAETLSAISRLEQEARTMAGNDPEDVADRSVSSVSKEFLFRQLATNRERLRKLNAALQRIRRGNFGICSECGDEIAMKRLEAMPWTEYCRECQEKLEIEQAEPAPEIG